MGKRAEGAEGKRAGTEGRDMAELPAFLTLGVFRGEEHLFDSPVPGEEVDGGEYSVSIGRGHCNHHGGGVLLLTRFRVWVNVMRRENGDSPGIVDGLMKRGEKLVIVGGEEGKRDGVNQQLCFVWARFENVPRRVAYRKGLVQPSGEGSPIRGLSGGGGVKVGTEQ